MTEEDLKANSLYDYVRELIHQYYPENDEPEMKLKPELQLPPLGIFTLEMIMTGMIDFPFTREDYDNATAILESLDAIGLDKEKFWLALQFIYCWVIRKNRNCYVRYDPSVQDRISDLIKSLKDGRTVVSIKRPGKRAYAIDDKETKKYLIDMLEFGDVMYRTLHGSKYVGHSFHFMEKPQDLNRNWWMMDMFDALKFLFDRFCTDKNLPSFASSKQGLRNKTLLVSRLIYLTRITEDERFLDDPGALKLVLKDCRKNPRPMMDSGLFY